MQIIFRKLRLRSFRGKTDYSLSVYDTRISYKYTLDSDKIDELFGYRARNPTLFDQDFRFSGIFPTVLRILSNSVKDYNVSTFRQTLNRCSEQCSITRGTFLVVSNSFLRFGVDSAARTKQSGISR